MKEEIATIIAKMPQGSTSIFDPRWHEQRMELARPKAEEILDYFEAWLNKHSSLATVTIFQEERKE